MRRIFQTKPVSAIQNNAGISSIAARISFQTAPKYENNLKRKS
jgi:hypothetical protein